VDAACTLRRLNYAYDSAVASMDVSRLNIPERPGGGTSQSALGLVVAAANKSQGGSGRETGSGKGSGSEAASPTEGGQHDGHVGKPSDTSEPDGKEGQAVEGQDVQGSRGNQSKTRQVGREIAVCCATCRFFKSGTCLIDGECRAKTDWCPTWRSRDKIGWWLGIRNNVQVGILAMILVALVIGELGGWPTRNTPRIDQIGQQLETQNQRLKAIEKPKDTTARK
jgi:hypothetical protein